jgi:hypothetical protein
LLNFLFSPLFFFNLFAEVSEKSIPLASLKKRIKVTNKQVRNPYARARCTFFRSFFVVVYK